MEYCHFSWSEAWDLPIEYRKWIIERKQKEEDKKREAMEKAKGKRTAPPPSPKRGPAKPT